MQCSKDAIQPIGNGAPVWAFTAGNGMMRLRFRQKKLKAVEEAAGKGRDVNQRLGLL